MQLWGIQFKPIVFAAIAIPVVVLGAVVFQQLQNRNFVPQTIEQREIDQNRSQLSAVRDLKGTWEGTITYTSTFTPGGDPNGCTFQSLVRLVINDQTETTIAGTVSYSSQKILSGHCTMQNGNGVWTNPVPFNGNVSGALLSNITLGTLGTFSGSYTTDTLTLHQDAPTTRKVSNAAFGNTEHTAVKNPISLLRKQ